MTHWYHGRSGDSFTDATIHADRDCPDLDAPTMPVTAGVLDDIDADRCPACDPEADDTCDVLKNDGDVCGRSLPCRYHS